MAIQRQTPARLVDARDQLEAARDELRAQHNSGSRGVTVCNRLTTQLDGVIARLFQTALEELNLEQSRDKLALVPNAGYGRREMAPFSDVDLMLLHEEATHEEVETLARRLWQDLYDIGLDLGSSVRTIPEALRLANRDAATATSLMEARFLTGNELLFRQFVERYQKNCRGRFRSYYDAIVTARREERSRYGETIFLLEPNIKRSRGGLREIQLMRWIGFLRFGTPDPEALAREGVISKQDARRIREGREFLLRLRNEMHFFCQRAEDILERRQQVRLAAWLDFRDSDGLLAVERFMREYFRHTSQIRYVTSRFVRGLRPTPMTQVLAPVFSHTVGGDYRVSWDFISASRPGLARLETDLEEVLRLAELANLYDRPIAPATWNTVWLSAHNYSDEVSPAIIDRFLALLDHPKRLGPVLRQLHELRVLEKLIPEFRRARGLLQFNEYHKFTVDEHTLRAVRYCAEFAADEGLLGKVYRSISQKRLLHLALLLHDLGKGLPEDHSDAGARIAHETCLRFGLKERETRVVTFLVQEHLTMSHMALWQDIDDPDAVLQFAVRVGVADVLKMLFVLTCADIRAVGPGVLNDWKRGLISTLYLRTMRHLGGESELAHERPPEQLREEVAQALGPLRSEDWYTRQVAALPATYLDSVTPDQAVAMLQRARSLERDQGDAWGVFSAESQTTQYTVVVDHGHGRGIFSRLAGALAAQGLRVLRATVDSLADELVLDRFWVDDSHFADEPPQSRLDDVAQRLMDVVRRDTPPKFPRQWGETPQPIAPLETHVRIDNNTSDKSTIILVFTYDQPGLLYRIARTLYECKLSVRVAKIGTRLDQVVDVFYVAEQGGAKVEDEARLQAIREALLAAIESELALE